MPTPRPLSVVKIADPNSERALEFQIVDRDRFIYHGEIPNGNGRCFVFGVNDGKRIAWMYPDDFVEVESIEF
jgi:hypothetical protein